MFKSLHVQNFQSHRDTMINFDPGVNVISGISQAGKTVVIRALSLVVNNRIGTRPFTGKNYSRFAPPKGSSEFELVLQSDQKIALAKEIRTSKEGEKIVSDTIFSLNGEEYSGTKGDVPDVIKQALNMSELNIQRQFDQPFLVLSSAGEVARTINRITRLDQVDDWVSILAKRINKQRGETDLFEKQAKEAEIELSKYVGFEDLTVKIGNLKKVDGELKGISADSLFLDSNLEIIEKTERAIEKLSPALKLLDDIKKTEAFEIDIIKLEEQISLIQKIQAIINYIEEREKLLPDLQKVIAYEKLKEEHDDLEHDLERVEKIEANLDSLSIQKDSQRKNYIKLLSSEKRCPTCLSEISDELIKKIAKEL